MAWLSRNDLARTDALSNDMLNNLANDDRHWGGNVNGGGYVLSNVVIDYSTAGANFASPVLINNDLANNASMVLLQGGLKRWSIDKSADAETGANAGSNFLIRRYDDAGNAIDTALRINRVNGNVLMNITAALTATPSTRILAIRGGYACVEFSNPDPEGTGSNLGQINWADKFNTANPMRAALVGVTNGATPNARGADLLFYTAPDNGIVTERMRMRSDGNVCIGTTAPILIEGGRSVLAIRGPQYFGVVELSTNQADADGAWVGRYTFADRNNLSNPIRGQILGLLTGTTPNQRGMDMVFSTAPETGALMDRMRIHAQGWTDYAGTYRITGQTDPTTGEGLEILYGSSKGRIFAYSRSAAANRDLEIDGNALKLNIYTNGPIITGGGLVGIGVSGPSEMLDIAGNIRLRDTAGGARCYLDATGSPGKVFLGIRKDQYPNRMAQLFSQHLNKNLMLWDLEYGYVIWSLSTVLDTGPSMPNLSLAMILDEGGNRLQLCVKYSNGTVRNAFLALG